MLRDLDCATDQKKSYVVPTVIASRKFLAEDAGHFMFVGVIGIMLHAKMPDFFTSSSGLNLSPIFIFRSDMDHALFSVPR